MNSKTLKNESLRTKFTVGKQVHLPRRVWTRCTSKMINFASVEHVVAEVGDKVIEHHGNKLCRFSITLGDGNTSMFKGLVIWEEWMLEKITVMNSDIKTPQTHPDHEVVGKHWGAHSIKHEKTAIYYCDSYDPSCGYWMTNVHDKEDRVNISERAPWRTYWPAEDKGDYFYISQWGVKVTK